MALPKPITISDESVLIAAALQPLIESYGGVAQVLPNVKDFWVQSSMSSQKPRILVVFNGEVPRGTFSQITPWHRVDRSWLVAVTKGRGFYANRGAGLNDSSVTEAPLYDVLETVRDMIRALGTISEETPGPDYRNTKPMQFGGAVIDGYLIEFTTANDIPSNIQPQTP